MPDMFREADESDSFCRLEYFTVNVSSWKKNALTFCLEDIQTVETNIPTGNNTTQTSKSALMMNVEETFFTYKFVALFGRNSQNSILNKKNCDFLFVTEYWNYIQKLLGSCHGPWTLHLNSWWKSPDHHTPIRFGAWPGGRLLPCILFMMNWKYTFRY